MPASEAGTAGASAVSGGRADEPVAVTETTEAYYDSSAADAFYASIWGGEDIHIGVYDRPDEDVATASARTVDVMVGHLTGNGTLEIGAGDRVLDVGAGYGGAGRELARRLGCQVDCLNLSEVQNERNRVLTRAAGLEDRVRVVHGNFEAIPEADGRYAAVWSQDAILHSGARERVLSEIVRVMAPGGRLVFTDPMQTDDCPPDVLQPILDRIHLDSLASPGFYRKQLSALGLDAVHFDERSDQLGRHYARVRAELTARRDEMVERCGVDYVTRMLEGLGHWVRGAERGHLTWGIFSAVKPG